MHVATNRCLETFEVWSQCWVGNAWDLVYSFYDLLMVSHLRHSTYQGKQRNNYLNLTNLFEWWRVVRGERRGERDER